MSSQIKSVARYVAIATGLAYTVALHRAGLSFDTTTQKVLGFLPAGVACLAFAFDRFLWRTPLVGKYFGRPDVRGTWLATLTQKDSLIPEDGNWGPIEAAMVIEQTFWSTSVHLITDESSSNSTAAEFVKRDGSRDRQRLVYTFVNTPQQRHQPRSTPHSGACELDVIGSKPSEMNGAYWTGRLTAGDVSLQKLDRNTDYVRLENVRSAAQKISLEWP